MLGTSVETLFERYRRRGDAGALARVFDRTAPELFRLAQHLVRDPLEAEDVLQDTFVAAIDAAGRWDAARPLVPWLTGILARKASETRRKSSRTIEPDRLHGRAEADPADLVADSELSVEIVQAIEALPELYRAVLLRHLLDGARPAEIARDLGRAPGTVRMQLHRGLEQLRRALPAGFAAGAALAAFAPRGLAAVREAVLTHAASVAAAGGAAAAAGTKVATLALWKVAGGSLIGLLLAVASVVTWRALAPSLEQTSPAAPATAGPGVTERDPLARVDSQVRESGVRQTSRARAPRTFLVGRVLGPGPEQMGEVDLAIRGIARATWPGALVARGTPAADGRFAIGLDGLLEHATAIGSLDGIELSADHQAHVPVSVRVEPSAAEVVASDGDGPRIELRADVELRPAFVLEGAVRRASSSSGPVHVAALPVQEGIPLDRILDAAVAGADGRFVLRLGEPGEVEVVAAGADTLPAAWRAVVAAGREARVPDLVLESGIRLTGRWSNGPGPAPLDGAWLEPVVDAPGRATVRLGERTLEWRDGVWSTGRSRVEVDAVGGFEAAGLEPGPWRLTPDLEARGMLLALVPHGVHDRIVDLALPEERVELQLGAGCVGVRLVDDQGRPVRGEVAFESTEPSGAGLHGSLSTTADGELVLGLPEGVGVRFTIERPRVGGLARELAAPAPGERRMETLRLPPHAAGALASIAVQAPPDVELPAEFSVSLRVPADAAQPSSPRVVALDPALRRLELSDLPEGSATLEAFAGGAYRHYQDLWLPALVGIELIPGVQTRASVVLRRGGRLRLAVRDGAGRFLPARCRVRDLIGEEQSVRFLLRAPEGQGFAAGERLSDLGPNEVYPNLAPGVYEVELSMEGRAPRVLPVRIVAGEVVELEVALP